MVPAARLVRAKVVRADQALLRLGHENRVAGPAPVGERRVTGDVPRLRVGLAGAEHGLEDGPERIRVGRRRGAEDQ